MADSRRTKRTRPQRGQALVEYVLIVVLVSLAMFAILAATGPAIGNIFSNTVYNLIGQTTTPYATLNATDFWGYVTAVASYTPVTQQFATYTPYIYNSATPPNTDTPGPSPTSTVTRTPTVTATNGPPPTPVDIGYPAPFYDSADAKSRWQYQFTDAFAALPWTVNYYNSAPWPNITSGSLVSGATTTCACDVNYNWGSTAPAAGVDPVSFGAAFTAKAPLEGREYQVAMVVGPFDGAIFKINGATILTVIPGQSRGIVSVQRPASIQGNPATYYDLEVDYYAGNGGQHSVQLVFSVLADTGSCGWNTLPSGRSPALSWQDSVGNYSVNSNCNLRLRGWIDISTLTNPRMIIWDKWALNSNATAYVGVRDYNFTNSNDWTWIAIHTGGQINQNWQREFFDLKNFNGVNFMTTGSKKIEIAYRLTNADPSLTADGWYIDDIAVEEDVVNVYQIPVSDDMDGATVGNPKWLPECSWAISNEQSHGGQKAWSDSPGTLYKSNSDCSLDLDGVIDLTNYGGANPKVPELIFWDEYFLSGVTTTLSVEAAPIDNRSAWQALTPLGGSNPYIAQGAATSSWKMETFNLKALAGNKYFFRFRLLADSSAAADGWYIDEIQWRERLPTVAGVPFYEPFETVNNWVLSGNWGQTTGVPPAHRSGNYALTDSPSGTYLIPSTGNANTAQLAPQINLAGTTAPKLEFWSYWDTAATVNLYLEMSRDGGVSWPFTLWKHSYNDSDPTYSTYAGAYNTNLAWRRYAVDLSAFACPTSCANISLRFRLEALPGSTPADGWYIDDLSVTDYPPLLSSANPFFDDIESNTPIIANSTSNWNAGGAWIVSTGSAHSGTKAWGSNPSGNYVKPEDALLELLPTLDLSGVTNPTLAYWLKYSVTPPNHFVVAEISTNGGATWTPLPWVATTGQPVVTTQTGLNQGWTRQQVDLTSYVSGPNKQIRLRWRLNALTTDTANTGIWLDDVFVGSRNTTGIGMPFSEGFEPASGGLSRWTAEGNWQTVNNFGAWHYDFPADNFSPVSDTYGGTTFNTQWDAAYYHDYTTDPSYPFSTGTPPAAQVCVQGGGRQISNYTKVGAGSVGQATSNQNTAFTWTDGTPNTNGSNSTTAIRVGGVGNGFQFTVPADTTVRTLKVYVGTINATGELQATLSDNSAAAYDDTSLANFTGSTQNGVYTFVYTAGSNGQTLTIQWTENTDNSGNGSGIVKLGAATLTIGAPIGAPQLTGSFGTPSGPINLTSLGVADWAHWGYTSASDFDIKGCIRSIIHQAVTVVNFTWDSTHVPAAAKNNASWTTDATDWEFFSAVFTRKMTVNSGTYRFWLTGDDGVNFYIDGALQTPKTNLPYPWLSAGTTTWIDQSANDYFYEVPLSAGQHTFKVDYYQRWGQAYLNFQVAEKSTLLHSGPAAQNYATSQDTGVYLNGGILVPASTTLPTLFSFYERYILGGTSGSGGDINAGAVSDPMYVKTSTDGGFTWTNQNANVQTTTGGGVPYAFNLGDQANGVTCTDGTFQNWQLHSVNLGTSATPIFLNVKFELDSRLSVTQGDGWYIDDITIKQ